MKNILEVFRKEFIQTPEIIMRKRKSLKTVNVLILVLMLFFMCLNFLVFSNIFHFFIGFTIIFGASLSLFLLKQNHINSSVNVTIFLTMIDAVLYFILSYFFYDNAKYLVVVILILVMTSLSASFFSFRKYQYLSILTVSSICILMLPIFLAAKHSFTLPVSYLSGDFFFAITGLTTILFLSGVILKTNEEMFNLIKSKEEINSELADTKHHMSRLLNSIVDGFMALDSNGIFTYVNSSPVNKLGLHIGTIEKGSSIYDTYSKFDCPELFNCLQYVFTSRQASVFEMFNPVSSMWFIGRVYPADDGGVTILISDITERKKMEIELFSSKNNIEQVLESISDGFLACDAAGSINYINDAALQLLNISKDSNIVGSYITSIFNEQTSKEAYNLYIKVAAEGSPQNCEYYNESLGKWFMLRMYPSNNEGISAFLTDITERKEKEQHLRMKAENDDLTGIYNRATCFYILEEQIKLMIMMDHMPLTICYIDLNNLKFVNDNFGHSEGDFYITTIVNAIKKTLRDSDIFGRIGGDEFLLILPNCSEETAKFVMNRAELEVDSLNITKSKQYSYGISVGISEYIRGSNMSAREFVASADEKMYQEKRKKYCKLN